jgi:hypothetical protein
LIKVRVDLPFIEVMMSLGCKLVLVEFSAIALTAKGMNIDQSTFSYLDN